MCVIYCRRFEGLSGKLRNWEFGSVQLSLKLFSAGFRGKVRVLTKRERSGCKKCASEMYSEVIVRWRQLGIFQHKAVQRDRLSSMLFDGSEAPSEGSSAGLVVDFCGVLSQKRLASEDSIS